MKIINKNLKRFVLILVVLISFSVANAQQKEVKKLDQQRYHQIIKENSNKTTSKKNDYLAQRALAFSFAQSELTDKAFDAYAELLDKYPSQADAVDKLNYALVARKMELYGLSDSLILLVKSTPEFQDKPLFDDLTADFYAENKEKRSDYWADYDFNSKYTIKPFPNASALGEYGVVSDNNGNCYYTSHTEKGLRKVLSAWFEQPYYNVFKAKFSDSSISQPEELSSNAKALNQHVSFYDAKNRMIYITRNAKTANTKKEKVLQIFAIQQNIFTKKWKETAFPLNNLDFSVADLIISPDGSKVVFVSDMPGGYGKSDLYEAPILQNDQNGLKLGEIKNLGPKINTALRDNFPRFSDSGDLYFSSEGHLGFGGLDVFTVDNSSGSAINLGKPVNSNLDDFAASFHENWGTMSSNRSSNGSLATGYNDNLYYFKWTQEKDSNATPTSNDVVVKVIDKDTKLPVANATVALDNLNDNEKAIQAVTDAEGNYTYEGISKDVKVQVASHPCGYRYAVAEKYSLTNKGQKLVTLIVEKYKMGDDLGTLFDVKPIYYGSNLFALNDDSKKELDRVAIVLKDNSGLKIALGSHTDSKGSDALNLELSKNRAKAVYDYLVSRGISKKRMSFEGYGETKIKNRCKNGVNCRDEEHKVNRRTEYLVSGIIPCGQIQVEEDPIIPAVDSAMITNDIAANTEVKTKAKTKKPKQVEVTEDLSTGPIKCGDADGDGIPDYLDKDSDNDGIPDAAEGKGDPDHDNLPNFIDKDSDNDGIPDAIEKSVDFDKDGKINLVDLDSDNDGIPDESEGAEDEDGDNKGNFVDLDSDDDGILDRVEKDNDFDNDGTPNFLDLDSDNDGITDREEGNKDTDRDGKPNFIDLDSDNDDIPDNVEGKKDSDNDGKPDYIDTDSDEDGILDKIEAPVCLSNNKQKSKYESPASKPSVKVKKADPILNDEPVVVDYNEPSTKVSGSSKVEYRVQFLMSKNRVSLQSLEDKGISNAFEYRDGGYYKYATGSGFATEDEAQRQKTKIRGLGYPDAFVVTFQNGRRVK